MKKTKTTAESKMQPIDSETAELANHLAQECLTLSNELAKIAHTGSLRQRVSALGFDNAVLEQCFAISVLLSSRYLRDCLSEIDSRIDLIVGNRAQSEVDASHLLVLHLTIFLENLMSMINQVWDLHVVYDTFVESLQRIDSLVVQLSKKNDLCAAILSKRLNKNVLSVN
jgi:hypothetical protein